MFKKIRSIRSIPARRMQARQASVRRAAFRGALAANGFTLLMLAAAQAVAIAFIL